MVTCAVTHSLCESIGLHINPPPRNPKQLTATRGPRASRETRQKQQLHHKDAFEAARGFCLHETIAPCRPKNLPLKKNSPVAGSGVAIDKQRATTSNECKRQASRNVFQRILLCDRHTEPGKRRRLHFSLRLHQTNKMFFHADGELYCFNRGVSVHHIEPAPLFIAANALLARPPPSPLYYFK